MTDKARLLAAFDAIGLKYAVESESRPRLLSVMSHALWDSERDGMVTEVVVLDEGIGYYDFMTEFYFDADGKFLGHGVWE